MENCKPVSTPMEISNTNMDNTLNKEIDKSIPFRSAIGSLNYLATISRPDIAFATNRLAQKVENPTMKDWISVKRIFRYLQYTRSSKLVYNDDAKLKIKVYSDADYGGSEDRKSTSGFIALINGTAVTWGSRKQNSVALSTMESEYMALAETTQEGLYLMKLLKDMGIEYNLEVFADNQSCIAFAENEKGPGKAKHIAIKYHFVKDLIEKKRLSLKYVDTSSNVADLFTKALSKEKLRNLVIAIGLRSYN